MSKFSGDTARAHRLRKQNTKRRMKINELRLQIAATIAANAAASGTAAVVPTVPAK